MSEALDRLKKLAQSLKERKFEKPPEIRIINSAGVVNDTRDFIFRDGSRVAVGTPYHIHTNDNDKTEIYMTGEKHTGKSKIIFRQVGNTILGDYTRVNKRTKRQEYVKPHQFQIQKKDIKRGFAKRYFVKENFGKGNMYECSENDGEKKLPMYKKYGLRWFVGTNKKQIEEFNLKSIENAMKNGFDISEVVSPLSGYIGTEDVQDKTESLIKNNVSKIRKNKLRKSTFNSDKKPQGQGKNNTPSSTPSSGGRGAY